MQILAVFLSLLLSASDTGDAEPEIFYDDDAELMAETGSTAVLGCGFTQPADFTATAVAWLRCDSKLQCDDEEDIIFLSDDVNAGQDHYRGRVSLLDTDLSKNNNCSIMIQDLRVSDSGSYHPIVFGYLHGQVRWLHATNKKAMKVAGLRQPRISGVTRLAEGGTLNLTCDAESSPPATVQWYKVGSDSPLVTHSQTATLLIQNVTIEHSGHYSCTAKNLTRTLTASADVTVIGWRQPRISGVTTLEEGGTLNLTCDAQSYPPPSTVHWEKVGSDSLLVNGSVTATLLIQNVTSDHSGVYSCTERHLNKTLTAFANVTVITTEIPPVAPVVAVVHHYAIIPILIVVGLVALVAPMAHWIHRRNSGSERGEFSPRENEMGNDIQLERFLRMYKELRRQEVRSREDEFWIRRTTPFGQDDDI